TPAGVRRFNPQLLVGAGGLHCPVSRRLGGTGPGRSAGKISLTAHVSGIQGPSRVGRLLVQGPLTVGLAPSDREGRWWNATVVIPSGWAGRLSARGTRSFYLDCLAETGLGTTGLAMAEATPLASSGFDRPSRRCFSHRTVLVGDAAGYFDPFTGQGIYQALRSSELLAPFLNLGLSGRTPWREALSRYASALSRERTRTRRVQQAVEGWLGSGKLRPALSTGLSRAPTLFGAIMEATTDRSPLGAALRRSVGGARPPSDATLRTDAPTPI
ncbi:MAG: hypothetical protein OEO23_06020, partial [Gemmatimonadota bacterium]|nr:hypothetical protein [Gemmatimonadota bacterium]